MRVICQRLPASVFETIFEYGPGGLDQKGLLKAKTPGTDSTMLGTHVAMRSIAKLEVGRTRLTGKAEHAVDLESEAIVAAHVAPADRSDMWRRVETLIPAQVHWVGAAARPRSGKWDKPRTVVTTKRWHGSRRARCAPNVSE